MVLPIGDINPTSRRAYVVGALTLANLAVFGLLQYPLTGCGQAAFIYQWSVIPSELLTLSPLGPAELERLLGDCAVHVPGKLVGLSVLSAMFVHGGVGHLLGNLVFLVVFGNNIEDRLGHARFLAFYLAGGTAATVAYAALQPTSILPLIGASGAVAAVLGAYLVLFPGVRVLTLVPFPLYLAALLLPKVRIRGWWILFATVGMPAWLLLGGWFLLQYVSAGNPVSDAVAYEAHVAGFLAGIGLLLLSGRLTPRGDDN
jgi:membrane associated rhomboid family serine protease